MNSVYDKFIINQPICNVLKNIFSYVNSLSVNF